MMDEYHSHSITLLKINERYPYPSESSASGYVVMPNMTVFFFRDSVLALKRAASGTASMTNHGTATVPKP